ncbi:hypothetical protein F444_21177 [Phytophthora nicotianae P1976]|uniref:Uncharacterized protein n=1 Tax=Phytophthora nicotianae P1976 TaxID=1317066 RepID=A0A080Z205_PHYNI|nr:hypothetical protein F444_21177 [Phytophthora nicotianae P1976]
MMLFKVSHCGPAVYTNWPFVPHLMVHVAQQYSILQNNNAKDSTNGKTRRYKLSGGVRAALSKKNECLSGENPASDRMASLGKAVR